MLSSNDTQIKVVCRIRPLNQLEISQGGQIAVNYNDKTIKIKVFFSFFFFDSQYNNYLK